MRGENSQFQRLHNISTGQISIKSVNLCQRKTNSKCAHVAVGLIFLVGATWLLLIQFRRTLITKSGAGADFRVTVKPPDGPKSSVYS